MKIPSLNMVLVVLFIWLIWFVTPVDTPLFYAKKQEVVPGGVPDGGFPGGLPRGTMPGGGFPGGGMTGCSGVPDDDEVDI
nr:hypothetical protein [Tanacetum cinerariifolium]